MLQGSNNNTQWVNLQTAAGNPANATNITANGSISLVNSNKFTINTNATAYKYYRIFGTASANVLSGVASEIFYDINLPRYQASLFPKLICTNDLDNDGKLNHLDLDSDGDGCADAIEAGSSTTATSTSVFPIGADDNNNGLLDNYESTTLTGFTNYTSTYDPNALSIHISFCRDSDNDGIFDIDDLDDDNDGILDVVESPSCFFLNTDWNQKAKSGFVSVSTELNLLSSNNKIEGLSDGLNTATFAYATSSAQLNKELLKMTYIRW
jgi:hypothetical protein